MLPRNHFVIEIGDFLSRWQPLLPLLIVRQSSQSVRSLHASIKIQEHVGNSALVSNIYIKSTARPSMPYGADDVEILVSDPAGPRKVFNKIAGVISTNNVQTVVIDITSIPTRITLLLCQWLAWSNKNRPSCVRIVMGAYTKPKTYQAVMGGGFELPATVDGFPFEDDDEKPIGWIPILGFDGAATRLVYDAVSARAEEVVISKFSPGRGVDEGKFERQLLLQERTYPVIGWPSFTPELFNRALWENRDLLARIASPSERLRYASADDPFATARCIHEIVTQRVDLRFICSIQGSMAMNLGGGLAASNLSLQLLHSFPQTQRVGEGVSDGQVASSMFGLLVDN